MLVQSDDFLRQKVRVSAVNLMEEISSLQSIQRFEELFCSNVRSEKRFVIVMWVFRSSSTYTTDDCMILCAETKTT